MVTTGGVASTNATRETLVGLPDNVNSAFFQTSVRVWPQYGRVEIRGIRKTWIGNSEPFTDIKHYILILKRENGVTWLDNFGETDDEKK